MGGWSRPTRVAALCGTVGLTSAALVLGMSPAAWGSPDNETIWEAGRVTRISDGDTLLANLTAGPGKRGVQRIRTIGVQAPEVSHGGSRPECGSAEATARLRAQLPVGAPVQTRSVDVRSYDERSGGRLVRSLYARDAEGNWYDTSRRSVSQGWLMWFPKAADSAKKPEWAHNLEYRVLADDAASQKRGLWSANLCGTSRYPSLKVRIWAKYWGTEQVWIENQGAAPIDLSRWIIRDAAISGYRTLPAGTVIPAGQAKLVYSGDLNLNNLPADNAAFEGDAVYLMEPASSKLGTGNLRAWFPYPCNPDACSDPLQGKVSISRVRASAPPEQAPSAPGSVRAVASVDGTGRVTVSWAAPTSPGSEKLTYSVTTRAVDGGAQPAEVTGVTGTSRVIGDLTLGRAYEFTVRSTNPVGRSAATAPTPAVSPIGLPSAPTAVRIDPQGTSAVISWAAPAGIAGEPAVRYAVTTRTAVGNGPACATTSGATSCVVTGLTVGQTYATTVTATLGAQQRAAAPVAFAAQPAAVGTELPAAPTAVSALAGSTRMVVGWTAPDQATSGPVTGYLVTATPRGGGAHRTCATTGETSCVITGLTNGTRYTASVTATTAAGSGPASAASPEVTPTAFVATRSSGPTAASPVVANPWIGGEVVEVTNTSSQAVRLGGYGLWDVHSSTNGNDNRARYLFGANQTLAAKATLMLHFGTTPAYRPPAPAGRAWVWTGVGTFINATDDVVELSNLNLAQVSCVATPGGSCRAAREKSVSSPPVGVTAQAGANRVTVTWGAPISTGGAAITRYTATAHSAAVGGSVLGTCSTSGTARSCSIAGRIGTKYFVDVVAQNAQGTSGPSWRVFAAPRTVPGAPARVVVGSTAGGLNVRWTLAAANGAAVTRYTAAAYAAATGGSAVGSCTTTTGTLTGCTIRGLRPGTRYYVQVRATNRAGLGQPTTPRVAGTPGVSRAVSTLHDRRVAVRWDASTLPAVGTTGYTARVYSKASGGSLLGSCTAAGATGRVCVTGTLKKQSTYYLELTTHTASGSFTNSPRSATGKPKKPGAPKVTAATPAATKRVTVRWTPGTTGYLPATRFQAALYSKSKKGAIRASCLAAGTTVACATTAVPKGTYYAAVRAANAKGWSPWSKRVKVQVR